jgi:hypothetical protein
MVYLFYERSFDKPIINNLCIYVYICMYVGSKYSYPSQSFCTSRKPRGKLMVYHGTKAFDKPNYQQFMYIYVYICMLALSTRIPVNLSVQVETPEVNMVYLFYERAFDMHVGFKYSYPSQSFCTSRKPRGKPIVHHSVLTCRSRLTQIAPVPKFKSLFLKNRYVYLYLYICTYLYIYTYLYTYICLYTCIHKLSTGCQNSRFDGRTLHCPKRLVIIFPVLNV